MNTLCSSSMAGSAGILPASNSKAKLVGRQDAGAPSGHPPDRQSRFDNVLVLLISLALLAALAPSPAAAQPAPVSPIFQVNTHTEGDQLVSAVASNGNGRFSCDTAHDGGAAEIEIPFAGSAGAVPVLGNLDGF